MNKWASHCYIPVYNMTACTHLSSRQQSLHNTAQNAMIAYGRQACLLFHRAHATNQQHPHTMYRACRGRENHLVSSQNMSSNLLMSILPQNSTITTLQANTVLLQHYYSITHYHASTTSYCCNSIYCSVWVVRCRHPWYRPIPAEQGQPVASLISVRSCLATLSAVVILNREVMSTNSSSQLTASISVV